MTTKKCPSCSITKSSDDFYKSKNKYDGLDSYCKCCSKARKIERAKKVFATQVDKLCSVCKIVKPVIEFARNASHGGYNYCCRNCQSIKWKNNITDERRVKYLLQRIKSKCKKENILFDLPVDQIIIPKICPVLGIPLSFGNEKESPLPTDNSPSIDRIIPTLGYVKNNIVIVSQRANRIKNDATIDELERVFNFYQKLTVGS